MKRTPPLGGRSLGVMLWAFLSAALLAPTAFAETAPNAPTLTLSMPNKAQFGQIVTLKARLADSSGAPIPNAPVAFTVPGTFFLGATGDVVVAEARTDKEGSVEGEFEVRNSGWLTVRADFRGNERFAAAKASAQVMVEASSEQLYVQRAGVGIPLLNAPPGAESGEHSLGKGGGASSGLATLWPRFSGWPIPAVLIVIWSLFGYAVLQVFRIAAAGQDPGPSAPVDRRRAGTAAVGGDGWHPAPSITGFQSRRGGADQ